VASPPRRWEGRGRGWYCIPVVLCSHLFVVQGGVVWGVKTQAWGKFGKTTG
jgi:hypothetical protein